MNSVKLTVAQAVIKYLQHQKVERDGHIQSFFAGCFGIFGHGNVGGLGQALFQTPEFKYYQSRNEQAMVHTAAAFAKMKNRLSTFACTSSIGPGATNMLTAAAGATINRLPVLLLPGDIFATRKVDPVLQQLESSNTQDISVNDCFKPISKYWDRINRPEQLISSLPAAMRVLISQEETGAVTICLPQDVQAESFDFPGYLFDERVWLITRPIPELELLHKAADLIKESKKPMIIAGGGVIYSEATQELEKFIEKSGIPVGETFAGKGSIPFNHPLNLGATGATGTEGANCISEEADLIIGIGTRYSDFTTASKTAFQNRNVKFININISAFDAFKHGALSLKGDAKSTISALGKILGEFTTEGAYRERIAAFNRSWDDKVSSAYFPDSEGIPYQSEVIGAVNDFSDPEDVVLCAAGSLPGDLHKLWRTKDPKGFHLEYGFSCMGYEIAGGLGAKMACPDREIYIMVGDGSYLMMNSEIVTSIQEGYKLTIILINNNGYASIGGLSKSLGTEGFGTNYQYRNPKSGQLDGDILPVDLAENARSLGAEVLTPEDILGFNKALYKAKKNTKTTVIYVETKPERKLAGYGHAWWEVPVSEISEQKAVQEAFKKMRDNQKKQRYFI
ncbi:3D-(3,5/4)-trihydroxycyclohexane-1,2-dione acylhydrolase (decyclizing) [Arthrospiribacter ruber]|uniref:3D-(3,5/4)-trihydroxycyclohexane-1,2-dione acylhydrolase (Decyclizing) n=1 Tax=Arthrospiribacter ruber TaxID=2487934 RepID=A0A951MEY9_9BACT|nr:3D-(3,5/4)-trihydroxycyclohexane-1,2-dione acylhydrolase (decyclizing) [Arthrospiribacter ruber]MBW3469527.1 3D-(3,5/4)-trihydroxycyclohexane-1,2-dione acylhydrolase (decyclizing) [Arthrospiribacter ruber]